MKAKALYSLSFLDTGHVCVFIYIIILETVKLGEGLVVYIKGQGKKWEKEVEEGFVWNPKREREREGDGGGREQGKESIVMKKKVVFVVPTAIGECWDRETKRKWFLLILGKKDLS